MNLLYDVVTAHKCRSTHHHIAIGAAMRLEGSDDGERRRDLLLKHHDALLEGAKAPDAQFKDFKNHVLHVGDNDWGGAPAAAAKWYAESVARLRKKKWDGAAYALGVMSHYYADPVQPFHTGQTEEEGAIHRAVEWSIAKSHDRIRARIEETGYPEVEAETGEAWVEAMVKAGALKSHPHYQTLIDHYDVDAGAKNPPAGLDDTLIQVIADLVAYATSGLATLYDRAFEEAGAKVPKNNLTLRGYLTCLDIPIEKLAKRMEDGEARKQVEAMYAELKRTGKVVKNLPADDKKVRKLHAREVLKVKLRTLNKQQLKPLGERHGDPLLTEAPAPKRPAKAKAVKVPVETEAAQPPIEETVAEAPVQEPVAETPVEAQVAETMFEERAAETPPKRAKTRKAKMRAEKRRREAEAQAAAAAPELTADAEPAPEAAPEPIAATPKPQPKVEAPPAPAPERAATEVDEDAEIGPEAETPAGPGPDPAYRREVSPDPDATLSEADDIEEAPSIGKKTAKRLEKIGVTSVEDLLMINPEAAAAAIPARHITAQTLIDWQDQAILVMEVPRLRGHDAQILVGAGIRTKADLAEASATEILKAAANFLETPAGKWASRGQDLETDEIEEWIESASG
ncbi:MAG: DUF4332 domain-containing protein [Pseudomonadota bacterium]